MIFFLIILVVGLALVYINLRALAKGKIGHIIAVLTLSLLFLGMAMRESWTGSVIVSFFAVWLCVSLLFYIPWTVYRAFYHFTQPHHLSHRKVCSVSRWLLGITVALTVAMFGFGSYHNGDYRTNLLTVDLPSQYQESFTAVFFSDIHLAPLFKAEKLERLVAQVESVRPDYVLFGGDLADVPMDRLDAWGYDTLFKKLTVAAKVAALGVNGNHEAMQERSGSDPDAWMRKVGFVVLDDSMACIGPACFTGRTDFMVARGRDVQRKPLAELLPDTIVLTELAQHTVAVDVMPPDSLVEIADSAAPAVAYDTAVVHRPWILLDHQPKGIEKTHSGRLPDFALSGHTHNGQFFPVTFIIDYVWKLAYGKGALDGVLWLVSSGFDCWGPPVRVGSDSEIWIIKFKKRQ